MFSAKRKSATDLETNYKYGAWMGNAFEDEDDTANNDGDDDDNGDGDGTRGQDSHFAKLEKVCFVFVCFLFACELDYLLVDYVMLA